MGMSSSLGMIFDKLENVWIRLCEFKVIDLPIIQKMVKRIVGIFALVGIVALLVFILSFFCHWMGMMYFADVLLVVMIMITWWAPNFLMAVLAGTSEGLAGLIKNEKGIEIASRIKNLEGEVRKLTKPLIVLAATLAFVNAFIQINGFGCLHETFFVMTSAVLALSILAMLLPPNRLVQLLPASIMTASVIVSLLFWYAEKSDDPIACFLNNQIQKRSLSLQSGNAKYYGITKDGSVVYEAKIKDDRIMEMESSNSLHVQNGEIVLVIDRKAKRFENELFVKIRQVNPKTKQFTSGQTGWIQIERLEISQMTVEPGKYALTKTGGMFLGSGKEVWTIHFLTSEPVNVPAPPLEAMYSFSDITPGNLYINSMNTPGIDSLTPAAISTEMFNTSRVTMTLRATAGESVKINVRPATSREKKVCREWYARKLASQ